MLLCSLSFLDRPLVMAISQSLSALMLALVMLSDAYANRELASRIVSLSQFVRRNGGIERSKDCLSEYKPVRAEQVAAYFTQNRGKRIDFDIFADEVCNVDAHSGGFTSYSHWASTSVFISKVDRSFATQAFSVAITASLCMAMYQALIVTWTYYGDLLIGVLQQ